MRLVDTRTETAADRAVAGPEVLLAGWSATAAETLLTGLRRRGIAARAVASVTGAGEAGVIALGPEWHADAEVPERPLVVALGAHAPAHAFFASTRPLPIDDTLELLAAAWKRRARPRDEPEDDDGRVLDVLRRLARESDLAAAVRAVEQEARILANAEHARVWIGDEAATTGVTGYVARTGRSAAVERLEDDPRWDAERDGDGGHRFLAVSIAIDEERVLAVVALRRAAHAAPFSEAEQQRVTRMARLFAPALARLVLDRELERRAAERHTAIREDVARLYRDEALEQYQRGRSDEAHLLEIEPRWTRYAYRVLLALLVTALLFSALVHVDREAAGVGVVRDGRLVAVVPARHRAQLRPGQPLRFEHASAPLAVTSVQQRMIAATDARRLLGEDGPRLWPSTDPAIRIDASLPDAGYGDGVTGRIRVRLGRERLLFAWVRRG